MVRLIFLGKPQKIRFSLKLTTLKIFDADTWVELTIWALI